MSPSSDETVPNPIFRQMTPDEAREDLLLRLRAEIEYLDSQVPKTVPPGVHPLRGSVLEWVIAACIIIAIFAVSGLIAGHLMIEVLKRAPL